MTDVGVLKVPSILQALTGFFVLLLLDFIWFVFLSKHVANYPDFPGFNPVYGLLAWIPLGVAYAAAAAGTENTLEAAMLGSLLGFLSYATFNGTELAIHPSWRNIRYVAADLAWGTVSGGIVAGGSELLFTVLNI